MDPAPPPIRLGLLGTGSVVRRGHLPALQRLPQLFRVTAVARGDAAKLAEAQALAGGARGYADWRQLLAAPEVDAVLLSSPNVWHAPQALAAIEAGKDVLCEKPPATNYADARGVDEAARRSGRVVRYGFLMRFAEETLAARRAVEAGALGSVYHVRATWLRRRGFPSKGSWFTTQALSGGGALLDLGSHLLDRALFLLGYPEVQAVSALAHARLGGSAVADALPGGPRSGQTGICDVEDLGVCLFRLAGGVSLLLEASFAANLLEQPPITELLGDRAGLRIERGGKVTLFGEASGAVTDTSLANGTAPDFSPVQLYVRQLEDFAQAVRTRKGCGADAEQGAKLMRALEAAYLSARLWREVVLEDV